MRELSTDEIEQIDGGSAATDLANNLYLAAGMVGIAAGATYFVPPISAVLWVFTGGLASMGAVASMYDGY